MVGSGGADVGDAVGVSITTTVSVGGGVGGSVGVSVGAGGTVVAVGVIVVEMPAICMSVGPHAP